jgi:hypothetical protein
MKAWYKKLAKKHFGEYQKAIDSGDTKAADFHMKEYLTYEKLMTKRANNNSRLIAVQGE